MMWSLNTFYTCCGLWFFLPQGQNWFLGSGEPPLNIWGHSFPFGSGMIGNGCFLSSCSSLYPQGNRHFSPVKRKKKRGSEINFFFLKNAVTEPWHNPFRPLNTLCQQWERTPQLSHFMPNVPGVSPDRGRQHIDHEFYLLWVPSSVSDDTCYRSCIPERQCVKDPWSPWFLCKVRKDRSKRASFLSWSYLWFNLKLTPPPFSATALKRPTGKHPTLF